jgi:hypothetical protein
VFTDETEPRGDVLQLTELLDAGIDQNEPQSSLFTNTAVAQWLEPRSAHATTWDRTPGRAFKPPFLHMAKTELSVS